MIRRPIGLASMGGMAAVLLTAPACAHGQEGPWTATLWTFDPWLVVPLYAVALGYWLGTARVWRRTGFGRGIARWQVACFWGGWVALALALLSPLHWLGERLFAAHMVEHCILIAVAPPLIVFARPTAAMLWALPKRGRSAFVALAHLRPVSAAWSALTSPVVATGLHGAALWAWHMPALYQLALLGSGWHRLEHASFTLTAMLFWWSLARGTQQAIKLGCLFVTTMHSGLLGLLLTLSPRLWCPAQTAMAADWNLTPLQDQQIAGLLMWVPMGCVYTAAALYVAAVWIGTASAHVSALGMADRSWAERSGMGFRADPHFAA
jgi:putative membrane protein